MPMKAVPPSRFLINIIIGIISGYLALFFSLDHSKRAFQQ
jgi:hypothetical protein